LLAASCQRFGYMLRKKYEALAAIHLVIDAVASVLALMAAYYVRFLLPVIPLTKGMQDVSVYLKIVPLVVLIFPFAFSVQGLYRIRSTRTRAEEWITVTVATLLGVVVLSGVLLWIRPGSPEVDYSRATLLIFAFLEVLFVMGGRLVARSIVERRYRVGRNLDRVVIVGSGELAREVVRKVQGHRELGFRIVGFLSDETEAVIEGLSRLGGLSDAEAVVKSEKIDHVFVALPHESSTVMMPLLDRLSKNFVSLHVVPDLLQYMTLRARVEDIDGLPTINLSDAPLDGWSRVLKRAFDLGVALVALLIVALPMAVIALLVWLEDRGPIFYRQVRMGLDGVPFEMLKFRSMKLDAESTSGPVWAAKDDPRTTRLGRFTRRWSLDELPQFWNVIRGEMSIVGPRPERPQFVEQFRSEYPHYMLRHKVRAGITGWAQVHGWRGNTSMRKRIEHDLYYIENWSLLLDIKIVLMTIRHGFRHENAY